MKRCSKCFLVDSLPGSNFSENGECHWCQTNFPNYEPKGKKSLREKLDYNKNNKGKADCLVGLSGGKDSTYSLIKLKEEFDMRVEAFIYIHAGSTTFSIRNAEKICEEYDIKLHKVSLENNAHLKSFISFFEAWLESPSTLKTGMCCVACKHLHILGYEIAKERNIPMIVWSTSPLEYSPFLAVEYKPSKNNQFQRAGIFKSGFNLLRESVVSPKLSKGIIMNFKTSLLGCLAAFPTSGFLKKRYPQITPIMFYDYYDWNPGEILEDLTNNTTWSIPEEIDDDWHSDCIFNIFKEYMFQKMLGVTYTDAHLSNLVRHGIFTKEEAKGKLLLSKKNLPGKIKKAVIKLKLEHLLSKIDFSCFDVEL